MRNLFLTVLMFSLCICTLSCTTDNQTETIITVEITPENWSDYFELVDTREYRTAPEQGINYAYIRWELVLKPQYEFVNPENSKIWLKVAYKLHELEIEIDHEGKNFTFVGEPPPYETTYTANITGSKHLLYGTDKDQWWCIIERSGATCEDEHSNKLPMIYDLEVLQAEGSFALKVKS